MGANEDTYALAGSARAAVCASGHSDGVVRVWDVLDRQVPAVELGTVYDQGLRRIAVSPNGHLVATAGFHGGVELWDWRHQRRLWSQSALRSIQRMNFLADGEAVVVDIDGSGTALVRVTDGIVTERYSGLSDAVVSGDGAIIAGVARRQIVIADRVSRNTLKHKLLSFAVLDMCFTAESLVVAETDGVLRALSLTDGQERLSIMASRWSAFMRVASIEERDEFTAWASMATDVNAGEIVRCAIGGQSVDVLDQRPWQHATPILDGTMWVFADRSVLRL